MSSAYVEVVNSSLNTVFANTIDSDIAIYPSSSNQNIHLGTTTGSNSMFKITTSNVEVSGQLAGKSNDTKNTPTYSWITDSNTGIYHAGTGNIGFSCRGSNVVTMSSNAVRVTTVSSLKGVTPAVGNNGGTQSIDISGLVNGHYIVTIMDRDGNATSGGWNSFGVLYLNRGGAGTQVAWFAIATGRFTCSSTTTTFTITNTDAVYPIAATYSFLGTYTP